MIQATPTPEHSRDLGWNVAVYAKRMAHPVPKLGRSRLCHAPHDPAFTQRYAWARDVPGNIVFSDILRACHARCLIALIFYHPRGCGWFTPHLREMDEFKDILWCSLCQARNR
jgi:hypothetical protein